MKRDELDEERHAEAIEYVMGTMPEARLEAFEVELTANPSLRAEVRSLRGVAEALAQATPEREASAGLWSRVAAATDGNQAEPERADTDEGSESDVQPWRAWSDTPHSAALAGSAGMFLARADDARWEPTATEGVETLRLFVDREADRVTMLVRMAPGSAYPAHRHAGPEECYVLSGDLEVGGEVEMHAGDFQRMEGGSMHPVQSTREGCLLFLTSSLRDELVA